MEKALTFDSIAAPPEQREQQRLQRDRATIPHSPNPRPAAKESQRALVVRLTKSERKLIEELSRDSTETFVAIFTKSIRLYRATVEAAIKGGSLVMLTDKSINNISGIEGVLSSGLDGSTNSGISSRRHLPKDFLATEALTGPALSHATVADLDNPVAAGCFAIPTPQKRAITGTGSPSNLSREIIASRYQFADTWLTPISLNPHYMPPLKGWRDQKVTLKADSAFFDLLADLGEKTGLKKSVVIRDSIRLYEFVKRKYSELGVSFFVGDIPIVSI